MRTKVEMAYFSSEDLSALDDQRTFDHLMHLANRLNNYIYAYRMLYEDIFTFSLSQGNLDSMVFYEVVKMPEWTQVKAQPFLINLNCERILTNLRAESFEELERFGAFISASANPFLPSRKFFAEARRYFWRGDYQEAIVFFQMTVESLINCVLTQCWLTRGKVETDIELWMQKTPFATRVKESMPYLIGGDWDYHKGKGAIQNWYNNVYSKRNKIVHRGFIPNIAECKEAFDSTFAFSNYLDELLSKKAKEYPILWQLRLEVPDLFLHGQELTPNWDID